MDPLNLHFCLGSWAAYAATFAARPVHPRKLPTCCNAQGGSLGPIADSRTAAKSVLVDQLIGESTRVLAPPIAHGTDDWAEGATLFGEDGLGPRGPH